MLTVLIQYLLYVALQVSKYYSILSHFICCFVVRCFIFSAAQQQTSLVGFVTTITAATMTTTTNRPCIAILLHPRQILTFLKVLFTFSIAIVCTLLFKYIYIISFLTFFEISTFFFLSGVGLTFPFILCSIISIALEICFIILLQSFRCCIYQLCNNRYDGRRFAQRILLGPFNGQYLCDIIRHHVWHFLFWLAKYIGPFNFFKLICLATFIVKVYE